MPDTPASQSTDTDLLGRIVALEQELALTKQEAEYQRTRADAAVAKWFDAQDLDARPAAPSTPPPSPSHCPDHDGAGCPICVARLAARLEHTQEFYATRLERLWDLLRGTPLADEAAAIMANGTASPKEPPTYAQQLTVAKHRAQSAEASAAKAQAEVDALNTILRNVGWDHGEIRGGAPLLEELTQRLAAAEIERDRARKVARHWSDRYDQEKLRADRLQHELNEERRSYGLDERLDF